MRVVVVGAIARDLVLVVDALPDSGASAPVSERQELLGGKGANQAVACRQLGAEVALVGVVGDDEAGRAVLARAASDGIDVSRVLRRAGRQTGLLVDVVERSGHRRLLEHTPDELALAPGDLDETVFAGADVVLVQLQTAPDAAERALRLAAASGALVATDGSPATQALRDAVLACAEVVRADSAEVEGLLGWVPRDEDETLRAARELLGRGPGVVALGASGSDVVAWSDGHAVLDHHEGAVDPTGGGDAFTVALTLSLAAGMPAERAARRASAAAGQVVLKPGGRPELDVDSLP
ncbi:PfkB family carbohydrate kinase [Herbiconiux sp. SYSU D00978]|uniref:PfkB family carbohydrate kinase n=1 Tax=Herbiconiux sp. SYSU D00978 TaxID=2812562 RepID=UPI0027DE7182|nr:PfkB family carbohydrate kinase [Herbiconiux sp. SYSU D00978]